MATMLIAHPAIINGRRRPNLDFERSANTPTCIEAIEISIPSRKVSNCSELTYHWLHDQPTERTGDEYERHQRFGETELEEVW